MQGQTPSTMRHFWTRFPKATIILAIVLLALFLMLLTAIPATTVRAGDAPGGSISIRFATPTPTN